MNIQKLIIRINVLILGCLIFGGISTLHAQEMPVTAQDEEAMDLFMEGRELFDNLRYTEARKVFEDALEKEPNFALANLYFALTATTDIEFNDHLKKAVKAKDEVSDGERLIIESVRANVDDKPSKAIAALEEAAELYPRDKRLHHMLGISYMSNNQESEAENQFEEAIQIDESFAPPYNNLGYLYRGQEKYSEAEEAFKKYVDLLPGEANPHDSIADLYTKMGKFDQAIDHYKKALELNPTFYFSQQKIGDNLIFMGRYEEGRKAYKKAIEMAPTVAEKINLHQQLAYSYLYEDNPDKTREENMTAIRLATDESLPENAATVHQMQAVIDLEHGNITAARDHLDACDQIMTSTNLTENRKRNLELMGMRNHAIRAAREGNYDKAITKAEKIRMRAEENMNANELETYKTIVGIVHYEKGDYEKAVSNLKKADRNDPYAQYYLAESYWKGGMKNEAQALFNKVANWNENSLGYALVRNKALAAAKKDLAIEED